jgi:hypothetical protein
MNNFAPQDPVQVAADLLDTVADNNVDHAIADIEGLVAQLKQNAEEAAAARDALRRTPAEVLRDAMRLRAARLDVRR